MAFSIEKFSLISHAIQKNILCAKPVYYNHMQKEGPLQRENLPDGPRLLKGMRQIEASVTPRTLGPGVPSFEEVRKTLGRKFGTQ